MASGETTTIRFVRPTSGVPWGFRLQGGSDYGTPICIQSVKPNSLADRVGLERGDVILAINNIDLKGFTHEEVKMTIIRAGNDMLFIVAKGAAYGWHPSAPTPASKPPIVPTTHVIKPQPSPPVTRQQHGGIQRGPNRPTVKIPKPQPKAAVPNVVHAQYNSPMGLYSAENIADSYAMQTRGIQKEMQGVDVNQTPVGTKMLGTFQILDGSNPQSENISSIYHWKPELQRCTRDVQTVHGALHQLCAKAKPYI